MVAVEAGVAATAAGARGGLRAAWRAGHGRTDRHTEDTGRLQEPPAGQVAGREGLVGHRDVAVGRPARLRVVHVVVVVPAVLVVVAVVVLTGHVTPRAGAGTPAPMGPKGRAHLIFRSGTTRE